MYQLLKEVQANLDNQVTVKSAAMLTRDAPKKKKMLRETQKETPSMTGSRD